LDQPIPGRFTPANRACFETASLYLLSRPAGLAVFSPRTEGELPQSGKRSHPGVRRGENDLIFYEDPLDKFLTPNF
jgi:hypothetical protein